MQSSYLDCSNCKKLGHEIETMKEQLREREEKLKILLQQLNENMSKAKKDRLALENENHRIKIKYAQSKVGQMLRGASSKSTPNLTDVVIKEDALRVER